MSIEYKEFMKSLLSKSNLVVHTNGTLNKQEPTINIWDPDTFGIIAFKNKELYDKHRFITSYPISEEAFKTFENTGNIGNSPAERAQERNELQRIQAQLEREASNARSFYTSLPENARMGNQQLHEVEAFKSDLERNPDLRLTEAQKNLMERAERYEEHKTKFYQNNPDVARDKL